MDASGTMGVITIYADGSSNGKSNSPGGWGYVVLNDGDLLGCGFGHQPGSTNNTMELRAAIEGLKHVRSLGLRNVTLVSDSQYCLGMASGAFNAVANADLCNELLTLGKEVGVTTRWVKGHQSDFTIDSFYNNWADKLAGVGKAAGKL